MASSTFFYQVLQWTRLSCGTSQREPGLKALCHIPRLKQKIALDKRPWEVEKKWETFVVSCLYSNPCAHRKARGLGLVFFFTIAHSVQCTVGLPPLQISRWLLPYLTSIYSLRWVILDGPTLRQTETFKKKKRGGGRTWIRRPFWLPAPRAFHSLLLVKVTPRVKVNCFNKWLY